RRGLSGHADRHGPSFLPVAGRSDLDLPAQAAGVHRSVRLVAEVLLADARAICQLAPEGQGDVRFRLSMADAGAMARRLRDYRDQGRGAAADPKGECDSASGIVVARRGYADRCRADRNATI